ncbi:MAG TPA: hypothetical protein VF457_00060, partial [Burkholderiaceae bacterium]
CASTAPAPGAQAGQPTAVASATPGRHCHKERPIGSDIAQTVCENDADYANGQATVQDIKDHMHPVTSNIK